MKVIAASAVVTPISSPHAVPPNAADKIVRLPAPSVGKHVVYGNATARGTRGCQPAATCARGVHMIRALFVASLCLSATAAMAADPVYQDLNRSFEERAADLVSRMTLEEKVAQLQNDAPAIPRLGVPAYEWWNEALHGVARAGAATVFPQAIGLSATFDVSLMTSVATVISDEARAKHHEFANRGQPKRYQGLTF